MDLVVIEKLLTLQDSALKHQEYDVFRLKYKSVFGNSFCVEQSQFPLSRNLEPPQNPGSCPSFSAKTTQTKKGPNIITTDLKSCQSKSRRAKLKGKGAFQASKTSTQLKRLTEGNALDGTKRTTSHDRRDKAAKTEIAANPTEAVRYTKTGKKIPPPLPYLTAKPTECSAKTASEWLLSTAKERRVLRARRPC